MVNELLDNPFRSALPLQPTNRNALERAVAVDAGELSMFAARSFRDTHDAHMNTGDLETYLAKAFSPEIQVADIADPATTVVLARDWASSDPPLVGYLQLVAHKGHVELKRLNVDSSQRGGRLDAFGHVPLPVLKQSKARLG